MSEMTRTDELLAYFDRLIEADKGGYHCQREIGEVISELRQELALGAYATFGITRDVKWAILQASKIEGASFEQIDNFIVEEDEGIGEKMDELRAKGYRIFFLHKPIGVIDDIAK